MKVVHLSTNIVGFFCCNKKCSWDKILIWEQFAFAKFPSIPICHDLGLFALRLLTLGLYVATLWPPIGNEYVVIVIFLPCLRSFRLDSAVTFSQSHSILFAQQGEAEHTRRESLEGQSASPSSLTPRLCRDTNRGLERIALYFHTSFIALPVLKNGHANILTLPLLLLSSLLLIYVIIIMPLLPLILGILVLLLIIILR